MANFGGRRTRSVQISCGRRWRPGGFPGSRPGFRRCRRGASPPARNSGGIASRRCCRNSHWLLLGHQLNAVIGLLAAALTMLAGTGSRRLIGDFGRPQRLTPRRRSILCLDCGRFSDIAETPKLVRQLGRSCPDRADLPGTRTEDAPHVLGNDRDNRDRGRPVKRRRGRRGRAPGGVSGGI